MRIAAIVLAALCVASAAAAVSANASNPPLPGEVDFETPSHNIVCAYVLDNTPDLNCFVKSGMEPAVTPQCAQGDPDPNEVYMRPLGKVFLGGCQFDVPPAEDAVFEHPKAISVLAYGRAFHRGGFVCKSQSAGLTCHNRRGHGFFLSRQHSYAF